RMVLSSDDWIGSWSLRLGWRHAERLLSRHFLEMSQTIALLCCDI
ncbi:hypothetical protein A2U01_0084379, partial [Trifolium medium]|nr:hypothetical protein [Trifolium medium]